MATYYCRADGTAPNKAAATSDAAAGTAMSLATHNAQTFSAGDIIVISDKGGQYADRIVVPSSGASGNPLLYQPSGYPVVNGNGTHSLRISTRNHVWINGIVFANSMAYFTATGDNVIINQCAVKNSASATGGVLLDSNAIIQMNNCAVHNNTYFGIKVEAAGPSLKLRNCAIYGNGDRGLYTVNGVACDYDYCNITGNGATLATNMTLGTGAVDGGHNIIEQAPGVRSYKNNSAYFVVSHDDNAASDGTGLDGGYMLALAATLAPYGVKLTAFIRCDALTPTGEANFLAMHNAGHEMAIHTWSHSLMDRTQAFDVTSTNASPTCNIDVAGQQIILATTTPGNSVTLAWAGDKMISDLQAAVAGKGWTITPKTSVQIALLLSSCSDSAGAQAVPYTALLDRTSTDKGFFYNEIAYPRAIVESAIGAPVRSYAFPGNVWDAGAEAYLLAQGFAGARANGDGFLSALDIFKLNTIDLAAFKGDGTETTIRKLANHLFVRGQSRGHVYTLLAHSDVDFTQAQWAWFVDELRSLGAEFLTFREAVAAIKLTHATTDAINFTLAYPDVSSYFLKPQSPCINAGEAVAGITTDYFGNPVPFGSSPDIGLHELQEYPALSSAMRTQLGGLSEVFGG